MTWNSIRALALTALVMGPWSFGMAQNRPVIRAQYGPVQQGPVYSGAQPIYHEGEYCEECEQGYCPAHCSPFGRIQHCWTYMATLGGKTGGSNGYNGQAARDPRQLNYQYLHRYRAPKNLVYPQPNQPAGVVVYPYYTVKGPDDFFLDD